ncbi:osmotically-inducible protein Y precursor [mine drainage metagenome]|uniref:Osmotically-inducible protein Y n=1 Tax=mine drainage metagenome TaxID=410659 RepID=A0A1J5T3F5_9ZZZZ
MKQLKYIATTILAVSLVATLGCAATNSKDGASASKQESAGEYIDDSVITTKVKAAVLNEPTLKSFEINVETYKGVVQLSGFVSSQANIEKAVGITRSIKGVTSVKNDMRLKDK